MALVEDATITHLLLQAGAAVDGRDEVRHCGCRSSRNSCSKPALTATLAPKQFQRTPLFWVAKRGAAEAALLAAAQGEAGAACSDSGSDTALTTLIDHGATVDALDEVGITTTATATATAVATHEVHLQHGCRRAGRHDAPSGCCPKRPHTECQSLGECWS